MRVIPIAVRRSISMAFRGRSVVRGARPTWLRAASDIRFVDHVGDDESTLVFEAPTLGAAAAELYEQQEFWPACPDPRLTGLDLLGDVVRDVASHNEDSDRFDRRLLGDLLAFKSVLNVAFRDVRFESTRAHTPMAVINTAVLLISQEFRKATPPPQRVRVVGTLAMVRASTQSFILRLDDGQAVRGVVVAGSAASAASHLNSRVIVLGRAVYRASGRLLRIDADVISSTDANSSLWSRIPAPRTRRLDLSSFHVLQGPSSGVSAIIGTWPGDETDEEISAWLEKQS